MCVGFARPVADSPDMCAFFVPPTGLSGEWHGRLDSARSTAGTVSDAGGRLAARRYSGGGSPYQLFVSPVKGEIIENNFQNIFPVSTGDLLLSVFLSKTARAKTV